MYTVYQEVVNSIKKNDGQGEDKEGKEDQIHGDGKRLDLGWGAHNSIYRCDIIKLYT